MERTRVGRSRSLPVSLAGTCVRCGRRSCRRSDLLSPDWVDRCQHGLGLEDVRACVRGQLVGGVDPAGCRARAGRLSHRRWQGTELAAANGDAPGDRRTGHRGQARVVCGRRRPTLEAARTTASRKSGTLRGPYTTPRRFCSRPLGALSPAEESVGLIEKEQRQPLRSGCRNVAVGALNASLPLRRRLEGKRQCRSADDARMCGWCFVNPAVLGWPWAMDQRVRVVVRSRLPVVRNAKC